MQRRDAICSMCALLTGVYGTTGCIGQDSETPDNRRDMIISDLSSEIGIEGMVATSKIVQPEINSERQGAVRLGMRWEGSNKARIGSGATLPITPPATSISPPGLVLGSEDAGFSRLGEGTWITERKDYSVPPVYQSTPFDPGEEVSSQYEIWGSPEFMDRIEPGEYAFEGSFSIEERPETGAIPYLASVSISEQDAR